MGNADEYARENAQKMFDFIINSDCDDKGIINWNLYPFPFSDEERAKAFKELFDIVVKHDSISSYIELKKYRQYVPILVAESFFDTEMAYKFSEENSRITTGKSNRSNKHWTEEEDNELIELVCADNSLFTIAVALGRSPASIANRLTKLVGLKRISQQVAGKFIGMANGEEFKANLVGTIYKG